VKPTLTQARGALLREITTVDEHGQRRTIEVPVERPLTLYVDKRELVTLMTLGQLPELLVLGYLLNQRLVPDLSALESVTVDWEVNAAAVRTRGGLPDLPARTERRVITTGCGQGTVFGEVMAGLEGMRLPPVEQARLSQGTLYRMLETMRHQESIHRRAGSVHGCALFRGEELLVFVEDVGRHIVSRNGVTAMGHEMAERLGMTLFGRALNRHFLCYTGFERFDADGPIAADPAT
jgi:FdhD protein